MYWIPIIGAMLVAGGNVLERFTLRRKEVDMKSYQVAIFLALVAIMLPFIYFFWRLDSAALSTGNILIFLFVVFFSVIANIFVFYSLKGARLSRTEPAKMLEPLFVVLLALIFSFFVGDGLFQRNFKVIIPAVIAGFALVGSHIEKHHLKFSKYFLAMIVGSFFFALELVMSRLILDFYSPMTFYLIRCFFIAVISYMIFVPNFKNLRGRVGWEILITAVIFIAYRIIIYTGYTSIGITTTTLLIMLSPTFIYLFAWKFLKDKPNWRNVVASFVIVCCILFATFA